MKQVWLSIGWNVPLKRSERGVCSHVLLIISIFPIPTLPGDPTIPSPSCRTLGLGEGLLVCVLFGVDLAVQEVRRQLLTVINF